MMSHRGRAAALAFLLAAASVGAEDQKDEWEHASFRTTIQLSLDAEDRFAEVDALLDRGRPNAALEALQQILECPLDDVMLRSAKSKTYRDFSGVKQAVRARLWRLCTEDPGGAGPLLRLYRSLYDPVAERLYRGSRAALDVSGLARVAFDYGATSWGDDALLTLGDLFAEQGNPAEALVYWEELLLRWGRYPAPPIRWESLVAKTVTAHLALGHRDQVARYVVGYACALRLAGALAGAILGDGGDHLRGGERLARDYLSRPVRVAGAATPLGQVLRTLRSALGRANAAWSGDEWLGPSAGGEPVGARARVTGVGPLAWSVDVSEVRNLGDLPMVHSPEKQVAWGPPVVNLMDVGVFTGLIQPFHPIVSRGKVYVLNDVQGRAWDLASGAEAGTFSDFVLSPTGGWTIEDGLPRVPLGLSAGLAASGRWLFAVRRSTRRLAGDDQQPTAGQPTQLPPQGVAAYDLAHGLRRQWDTTDVKDEESRAFYDTACFHGPPASDEHSVYIGAYVLENDVKAYLCSIDIATGRLNWKTFLCAEALSSFSAVNPRPGLAPLRVDGLVIWCSNQGVIGGFDALTGEVRWLLQYARRAAYAYGGSVDIAPGWADNPPVVCDRVLYLTPQDGEVLVVADARTGRPHDFHPRTIEGDAEYKYLVGSPTGEVYLLGSRTIPPRGKVGKTRSVGRVLCYDPRAPQDPGIPLDLPDDVVGRGRAVGGYLYCPTRKGLCVADFTRPGSPALLDPLVSWEDPEGVSREAVVLQNMLLIASGSGTLEAFPVKR